MLTMNKKTEHADMVVRVPNDQIQRYYDDGWQACPNKVWRRSDWATKKDLSGPSTRVRIDPVRERTEKRAKLQASHWHWKVKKVKRATKWAFSGTLDTILRQLGLGCRAQQAPLTKRHR